MSAAVRAGYKQTEVGVIPAEWNACKLKILATFRTGPFGSALHKADYTSDGIPIVNPMHIIDGRIEPSRTMTITESAATALADFRLKAGEVVIGRRGDMGRCAVVREAHAGWLCGTGSMIVRPVATVDAEFLQRVLSSGAVISAIENSSVGSTMINLNQGTLGGLDIQTPPFTEQRAIVTALSDVDALLSKLDALIAKKRDLKQAAMQQLLTGQTRLPGFSGEWELRPLRSVVADLEAGISVNSIEHDYPLSSGEPCILKTSAILDSQFNPEECKLIVGRDIKRAKLSPKRDTIIVSRMNTPNLVGEVGYVAQDFPTLNLPDRLWMTRFHSGADINVRWLAFVLSSPQVKDSIKGLATGTSGSMKNIGKSTLLALQLAFPEGDEQTAIATVLSDMDAELTALEARRDKTRALKQGMMQELLTGRIRLV